MNNRLEKLYKNLLDNPSSLGELASYHDLSKEKTKKYLSELKKEGINVSKERMGDTTKYYVAKKLPVKDKTYPELFRFGLIGDTHLGNKYTEEEALHGYYNRVEKAQIEDVFHAGDLLDGVEVYQGQLNDLRRDCITTGDQINYCINEYPKRKGVKNHILSGNHDLKQFGKQGVDPVEIICKNRKDMEYLGQYYSRIRLKDDILMEVIHPTGGGAYAKDYKFKTHLRERPISSYPDILVLGHYHSSLMEDNQGTLSFMPGTFLGDTEFTRRRGLSPALGGWLLEFEIEDGDIKKCLAEWVKY